MNPESPPAPEVTLRQTVDALGSGALLIDVREPEEYAGGHVPEARLIPLGELLERTDELNRDVPIHVICAVGGRSMAAAGALRQLGFDAVSVAGGTHLWEAEGGTIVTDTH